MEALYDKMANDEAKARQFLVQTNNTEYEDTQNEVAFILQTLKQMKNKHPDVFSQAQCDVENAMKGALKLAEKNMRNSEITLRNIDLTNSKIQETFQQSMAFFTWCATDIGLLKAA